MSLPDSDARRRTSSQRRRARSGRRQKGCRGQPMRRMPRATSHPEPSRPDHVVVRRLSDDVLTPDGRLAGPGPSGRDQRRPAHRQRVDAPRVATQLRLPAVRQRGTHPADHAPRGAQRNAVTELGYCKQIRPVLDGATSWTASSTVRRRSHAGGHSPHIATTTRLAESFRRSL